MIQQQQEAGRHTAMVRIAHSLGSIAYIWRGRDISWGRRRESTRAAFKMGIEDFTRVEHQKRDYRAAMILGHAAYAQACWRQAESDPVRVLKSGRAIDAAFDWLEDERYERKLHRDDMRRVGTCPVCGCEVVVRWGLFTNSRTFGPNRVFIGCDNPFCRFHLKQYRVYATTPEDAVKAWNAVDTSAVKHTFRSIAGKLLLEGIRI